ncbi:autotransporter-associated beta strand protein [Pedobacter sp. W3I1]|uniref:cellulose binding domain-containing protein n=1 Tax=Pedobacter sp. W3I1 TaxID=3042291 RepID=UPI0027824BEF|nr:cellulose binding domain-containing protein [Pedobacter sp. W3I1]MDQ0641086.1 autotransporter-associated beta strand protein [Pedobacter sp. W3I1]
MRKFLLYQLKLMAKKNRIFFFFAVLTFLGAQSTAQAQTLIHPGIALNQADLNQLKANITREPWLSAYNSFKNDARSKLTYVMAGPFATVTRAPDLNNSQWRNDMVAVHNLAFMWWFTGDSTYARKATNILDAWAVTNTTWGGGESMLDIGDYAQYWGVGAEILRYTFPGWTAANTQHVEKYFSEVLFPTSFVPFPLRDQNKGAIQLKIALAASVFCNDVTRFNQSIEVYRMDAGGGMRNSLPNGEVGDTGRDDHWRVQAAALAWGAEVAYKQKIDMFAELDNRVLAIGELYHQYAFDGATMTYIPFGGYASYWTNWGINPGARVGDMTNLIYNAYKIRKGIPTPHTDRMRAALGGAGGDFLYLKSSDTSTAITLPPVFYPADHVQPVSNLTNTDIGNPGLTGSAAFNNGIWTLKAAGTSTSNAFSFNFKKVSGNAGLVVKVDNMSLTTGGCGVMLRESLAPGSAFWDIFLGANGGVGRHGQPKAPWWLKIERVGTRIFAYHSQDGVNWTNLVCWYSATGFPANLYAGFYTVSNNVSAQNTATFSNVGYSQSAPTGSPEISSATTAAATVGAPFSYSINASGNPVSYSASGLPAGLTLDAATGIISGTPTELGKSEVTLASTNNMGSGTATLILNVIAAQAPAAPASMVASVVNSTQIKLSWAASANATTYSVKRSLTPGGTYTTIQSGITGTSFTDLAPASEVNNYYVVTALTGDKESVNSNEVFASVPPAIPSQPIVVNQSDRINLTWDAASGAVSYKVKRGTVSGGPYTTIATVSTTAYEDTAVASGSPYYYVISSVGTTKESANSIETFGVPGASSSVWSSTPLTDSLNLASNWIGNTLPVNPAILTFNATTDSLLTNDINGIIASRIQFGAEANTYTISGNALTLKNDLVNNSSNPEKLTMPIILGGQLNVAAKTNSIELNGMVSGTGSLLKTGNSALVLSGANTYSGNTIIRGTRGYAWGSTDGIQVLGIGTGTSGAPTSGPLGTGKIIMEGGALYTGLTTETATLYNDIEVPAGQSGFFYERMGHLNLYGKISGSGGLYNDGSDNYATISLYGDNSGFTGTFITKLRSGSHRLAFATPQSGSANAAWLLDAQGIDCHRIMFASGVLEFGSLSGRGGIRSNVAGTPVIRIGALNTNTNFGGTMANAAGTLSVEKVGTGILTFSGNSTFGGSTTVLNGTFLLNNGSAGTYNSPIVAKQGSLGGGGKNTSTITIGTGSGAGATLVPGTDGTIGTLSTTGLITLNTDATYKVDVNGPAATADKVIVGAASLNQSRLLLNSLVSGSLPMGTNFTILDNTGTNSINGIFKDLPEMSLISAGSYNFRITYKGGSGNDVQLLDDRTLPVTITSALTDTALIGKNFTYTITAIKSPTNATGLPAGLSINTATGVISGTPGESGLFSITLTASNETGADTAALSLKILSTTVSGVLVAAGDAKNIVEWDAIQNFTYHVKRSATSGGPYTTIASVGTPTFTDTNVSNGTSYYYVVALVDSTGEMSSSAEVVATPNIGQVSYLKFDETSGMRGIDSWGARHGLLAATAGRDVGKYGKALKLDGTANAYATLPTGIVSALNDFTISTWLKMDAKTNWMRVFDFGAGTSKYMFLSIQAGSANVMRYAIKNGGAEQVVSYNYTLPLNTWTHLAITQSGNTCTLYINGTAVAANTGLTIKPSAIGSTTLNYLGRSQFNDPLFNGSIDEFKLYSRALTAAEIAQNMKLGQNIIFNALAAKGTGDADFDPAATATSGLPVTYVSSDPSIATIVDGKIHIIAAGTSNITASQAGNTDYTAAQPISRILTVKNVQTISFPAMASKVTGDVDFDAGAIASSGLTLSYNSSDPNVATVVDGKLHILTAGTTTITASQAGNAQYLAATPVSQVLTVKNVQTINFAAIAPKVLGDADFTLEASATSGIPVSFSSSDENVATVINSVVHILKAGTTTFTATQPGNGSYSSANATQSLTILPLNLKVLSADGDNGQQLNNVIRPKLKIVNEDTTSTSYSQLTARYWFTAENFAGINTWIDYAQMGNSKVKTKYIQLNQPKKNAYGYVEYSFDATAGTLAAGAGSGIIESGIANTNWANFTESNDFSYQAGSTYVANSKITLYRNGVLVWGVEPQLIAETKSVKVLTESKNAGNSTISTYLKVENTGNTSIDYKDIAIRYFFTPESAASLDFWVDYANLGAAKIKGQFVAISPSLSVTGSTYLELKVDSSAGKLYPLSGTGNIQYRIAKSDWSSFNQLNDYSYQTGNFAENNHVCVYYKGELIYGTAPAGSNNQLAIAAQKELSTNVASSTVIYPNPVTNSRFSVTTTANLLKKDVEVKLIDLTGRTVYSKSAVNNSGNIEVQLQRQVSAGVYVLLLNNQYAGKVLIN